MKTIKYLLIVLLAGFSAIANAQEKELNAALDAIKSKAPNAADLANTAYKKNKKNAEALVKIGRAFFEQKDATNAAQFARYANEAGNPKYQYAPAYLLLGDVEATFGSDGSKAAAFYNQAINFDPKNPEGYKKWAKVYYKVSPSQAAKKLLEMKANCPNEDIDAIAAQIFTQTDDVKNTETNTNTNKFDEIIELIKKGFKDPSLSKLYTNPSAEKIYEFEDEENIAFQGRACWKTNMEYLLFGDDYSMGIITAATIDVITASGGHGQRVYKIGPKGKECRYILVNGIIYKWEKEDYSDLQEYLLFNSNDNTLQTIDKQKKFKLVNNKFK
jgi:tetratricopeptide (TPR) repeat protein